MICRFCSQWNPDGEQRCCFCDNRLDAELDTTVQGKAAYEGAVTGPLPAAPEPRHLTQFSRRVGPVKVDLHLTSNQVIGGGVFLMVMLILLVSRC